LAVSLDGAALSVALPTLATALHTSASDLEWFWSGYLLLLAAAVLSPGRVRSTRGLIDADQQGWGDADAVAVMAAGRSALGLTERQCNRRVRERFSEGARILELGNVELRKGPMADAQARVPGAARVDGPTCRLGPLEPRH
jgi:hypothetical protein